MAARVGATESVIVDGDSGMLVPPSHVDALVRALDSLMADPARVDAMGRRARERAISKFSIDTEVTQIVDVYRNVLGSGNHGCDTAAR